MDLKCSRAHVLLPLLSLMAAISTGCGRSDDNSRVEENAIDLASAGEFRLTHETYRSCEDLQASVRKQLVLKKKSDSIEKKYWAERICRPPFVYHMMQVHVSEYR